jgi:hypothetical protein
MVWNAAGPVDLPWQGWLAMALGTLATVALGGGLMALVFYSSRKGYDDDAYREFRHDDAPPPE